MKKINNIKVNFNKKLLNFYEWDTNDKIVTLKNVICIKVNNDTYLDIINNKISIYLDNDIYIFCNDYDAICIKFKDNISYMYSKLLLEDEFKLLDIMQKEKVTNIDYKIIDNIDYSYNTRQINNKINYIIKYIESNHNNTSLIKYLSLEIFNKDLSYSKLINLIKISSIDNINNLYEIVKLVGINA